MRDFDTFLQHPDGQAYAYALIRFIIDNEPTEDELQQYMNGWLDANPQVEATLWGQEALHQRPTP